MAQTSKAFRVLIVATAAMAFLPSRAMDGERCQTAEVLRQSIDNECCCSMVALGASSYAAVLGLSAGKSYVLNPSWSLPLCGAAGTLACLSCLLCAHAYCRETEDSEEMGSPFHLGVYHFMEQNADGTVRPFRYEPPAFRFRGGGAQETMD